MRCQECATAAAAKLPTRRALIAGLACVALAPGAAAAQAGGAVAAEDERFMRIALAEARRADFPFGAVIVRNGREIARGRNLGRTRHDPTAHGEMVAIRNCVARARRRGLARQHALHHRRALRDVHGRDPMEPCGPACVRGLARPARNARSTRSCSPAPISPTRPNSPHLDHRRRAGRRGDEAFSLTAREAGSSHIHLQRGDECSPRGMSTLPYCRMRFLLSCSLEFDSLGLN